MHYKKRMLDRFSVVVVSGDRKRIKAGYRNKACLSNDVSPILSGLQRITSQAIWGIQASNLGEAPKPQVSGNGVTLARCTGVRGLYHYGE